MAVPLNERRQFAWHVIDDLNQEGAVGVLCAVDRSLLGEAEIEAIGHLAAGECHPVCRGFVADRPFPSSDRHAS